FRLYAKDTKKPSLAGFLENPSYNRSLLDFISQYERPQTALLAVKRKCKMICKNWVRGNSFFKGVNWKLLLNQAKTRGVLLANSTKLLASASEEATQALQTVFD
ncbi:hypothetical protein DFQ29_003970, partial [Apophysomyces sp. BC1021]